jgi:hypothetical protein
MDRRRGSHVREEINMDSIDDTIGADTAITTIAILQCSKTQLDHPAPAVELYTGQFYRWSLAWARQHGMDVRIISAKHGLLQPWQMLQPYDVFPDEKPQASRIQNHGYRSRIKRRTEFNARLSEQLHRLSQTHGLVYLCNKFWVSLGPKGETPLAGMGMFDLIRFYKRELGPMTSATTGSTNPCRRRTSSSGAAAKVRTND